MSRHERRPQTRQRPCSSGRTTTQHARWLLDSAAWTFLASRSHAMPPKGATRHAVSSNDIVVEWWCRPAKAKLCPVPTHDTALVGSAGFTSFVVLFSSVENLECWLVINGGHKASQHRFACGLLSPFSAGAKDCVVHQLLSCHLLSIAPAISCQPAKVLWQQLDFTAEVQAHS